MSGYMGLIELFIVLMFFAGWGAVELVGMRLDRQKAAHKPRRSARRSARKKSRRR